MIEFNSFLAIYDLVTLITFRNVINILGIKDKDDRYVIPIPRWSKTVYAAGTKVYYYHVKDIDINKVYIPGPTTEKLTIVVSNVFRKVMDSQL